MNNIDITPQMALSAARVLRDYCKNIGASCKKCVIKKSVCESQCIPEEWILPEMEDSHE